LLRNIVASNGILIVGYLEREIAFALLARPLWELSRTVEILAFVHNWELLNTPIEDRPTIARATFACAVDKLKRFHVGDRTEEIEGLHCSYSEPPAVFTILNREQAETFQNSVFHWIGAQQVAVSPIKQGSMNGNGSSPHGGRKHLYLIPTVANEKLAHRVTHELYVPERSKDLFFEKATLSPLSSDLELKVVSTQGSSTLRKDVPLTRLCAIPGGSVLVVDDAADLPTPESHLLSSPKRVREGRFILSSLHVPAYASYAQKLIEQGFDLLGFIPVSAHTIYALFSDAPTPRTTAREAIERSVLSDGEALPPQSEQLPEEGSGDYPTRYV
jgi:hypothetical protein